MSYWRLAGRLTLGAVFGKTSALPSSWFVCLTVCLCVVYTSPKGYMRANQVLLCVICDVASSDLIITEYLYVNCCVTCQNAT